MKRNVLALAFFIILFVLITPLADFEPPQVQSTENQSFTMSGIGDDTEDYVDQISNLHAPTDIGTHSVFADLQDYGPNYDQMQEANTGGAGVDEFRYVDGLSSAEVIWTTVGTSPYLSTQNQPTDYIHTSSNAVVSSWYTLVDTSGSGSAFTVNGSIYWQCPSGDSYPQWEIDWTGDGVADASGSFTTQAAWGWAGTGTISGLDTATEINAARWRFIHNKGGSGPDQVSIDAARLGISQAGTSNYELDLEIGWTTADYDETFEQLCIYPVTGGGWPSEDIKVDIWTGAWTNLRTNLTPDEWNNVSISSYLTDGTVEVRFLGGTETGDTTQDTWEIDAVLIHTWTPSYAPVNDQAPSLDNPTDTDNMYGQYLEYQVTVYTSDQNGFADIDYLEIGLWDNTQTTEYCRFMYDEDTNIFTEEYDGGTYVSLNTGSSTAIESGNDINATFYFTIDWDFPDSTDLDAKCYVIDTQTENATTWYEVNWHVETRLDYAVAPAVTSDDAGTIDRGDLDENFALGGTLIYYGSIDNYPSTDQVDVWVSGSEYGTDVGPWSDLTLTNGAFNVACAADDAVGQDTYTAKPVIEDAGSGGTSLYYTTDLTDTYIADQLTISMTDPTDQRININANATGIVVTAIYQYDSSAFLGTFNLNDTTFDYGVVGIYGYTVSSVSGGAHGVTTIGTNDETYCIFDSVTISMTDPFDQRQNLNANATGIVITGIYDYDSTAFDGTFSMNNTDYDGDGTVVRWDYTVSSISGGTHGITVISTNDDTYHIWDSVTITIVGPTDNRQNINANATGILVSGIYDYDSAVFDGTFTMNNTDYNGDGTVVKWGYTVDSVSGDPYGITTIGTNDETYMIWDSITISITDPLDQRNNINTNASGIIVSAVYDYDGTVFDGTFTMNNTDYNGDGTVVKWGYTVSSVSGDTCGITAISSNDETYMIWDSITISITNPSDQRNNINTNATGIIITAIYDYDSTVFDGTFTLNDTTYQYATVGKRGYTVQSVTGDTHGITTISTNDETYCIWDSLTITITDPSDQRININANASGIVVTAIYDYDSTAFDGSLTLNDTTYQYASVGKRGYTVLTASGDSFGITTISANDETYCIWDSLTVTITGPTDNRQNLNANASGIVVSAVYDYDGSVFDGTLALNQTDYDGDGTVVRWGYTVDSASGDTHGITVINTNDETYMIWDSITITITGPTDSRININTNASGIIISAIYNYDSAAFDGTFTLNDTTYDYGVVGIYGYTVSSVSGDTYGITTIGTNDDTWCIFDSITISMTDPSDQRDNLNANATGIVVTAIYDYDSAAFDGTFSMNNTDYDGDGTAVRWGYTVSSVSGDTHGITVINSNDETYMIWDSITVTMTDPTDQRGNLNANATGIVVSAIYDYDSSTFDGTFTLNQTDYDGDSTAVRWGYTVSSVSGDTHGITTISSNDETYMIWDSLTITITDPTDSRNNINTNATGIYVSAIYDYDSTSFDGTLTLNHTTYQYATAQKQGYTVSSASGGTYGITTISTNDETYCIWDSLTITITDPSDQRINLNSNATGIVVSAIYDYDSSVFDGTLTLNDTTYQYATVGIRGYTIFSVSGDTYGITSISSNDETYCIWDRLVIDIQANDEFPLNAVEVTFTLTVTFDYDDVICTTYQIAVDRNSTWWYSFTNANKSLFVDTNSDTVYEYVAGVVTIESTHGITSFTCNTEIVTWSDAANSAPVNDIAPTIYNADESDHLYAKYRFYLITSNCSDSDGYGDITYIELSIWDNSRGTEYIRIRYTVIGSSFSIELGSGYITLLYSSVVETGNDIDITWSIKIDWDFPDLANFDTEQYVTDSIDTDSDWYESDWEIETQLDYSVAPGLSDDRDDVNTATLQGTGTVIFYGSSLFPLANETDIWITHDVSGTWSGDVSSGAFTISSIGSSASVRLNTYTFKIVVQGTGSSGADLYYTTSFTDTFITDQLIITITDPTDSRININANASGIIVSAIYQYDSIAFDGTFTLNDTTYDYGSVGKHGYTVSSVSGDSYGVTTIGTNDETYCIFDSVTISMTDPFDQRQNLNANATGILVTGTYDYDSSAFDGTFTLNQTDYNGDGTATKWGYTVDSISGDTHGITIISTNDDTHMIWDSITVSITGPTDNRQNLNVNASGIVVTAIYDYDGALFDGTFTLNNTDYNGDGTVVKWGYTVDSVSGDTHGITTISTNDETYMIWDSLTITITDPDQRIDINTNATGIIVSVIYDYDSAVFDGSLTLNDTTYQYATVGKRGYTVSSASGDSYGITIISTNDETYCIWDSVTVTITDPSDQRININANASGIIVSAIYNYDGSAFDGTFTLNNTQFTYATVQRQAYTVQSVSDGVHGITEISVNDEAWCIWDQLVVTIGVDDASSLNGHQANFTLTVTYDYDDAVCTTYQIVIDRNATWWNSFTDANVSLFVDIGSDVSYFYNASLVSSESTYGITMFITNTLQVTWSLAPNEVPVNDSSPVLTNGDDIDYLYARYRYYGITTSASDLDGYADISYVELTLYSDDQVTQYWTVRYTVGTNTFSVESGGSIVVVGAMSNAVGVGDTLTITWHIKIDWDHPDIMDSDILQFLSDGTDSDSDFYETDWNVETRLDYSVAPSLSDDRGDVNTADLVATGSTTYYGSSLNPLSNETDVWVLHDLAGTWNGNLAAGSFSISGIGSSASVRLNTYTIKIVAEGSGSGGTDLYFSTSMTDTFITDRIEIYAAGVVDSRININSDCEVWWRARFEYDGTEIQSALILELNGSRTLVWDAGSLHWRWQETSISPASAGFDVASASESTYGLIAWSAITSVQQVIWDALVVTLINPVDQRIDVGANATGIFVSAVYAFDGAAFDGIFVLNNTNFQYAVPQVQGYTVLTASGDTYGITAIQSNDATYCIWDRVLVVSVNADEIYHDPDDDVVISAELQYEYDSSPVLTGTFAISGYPMTHVGSGVWEAQVTISTYQAIDFDDLTASDAALHGISEYNMDGNSATVYWDRLEFYSVSVDDDRINVGASAEIQWSVRLENAGVSIATGATAQMTGAIALTASAGAYTATITESAVGSVTYSIMTGSLGEIDQFIQSASDATVIWDQVLLTSIVATSLSLDIGTTIEIRVTLVYEFDSTDVTTGVVNLDDNGASVAMSYNSAGGYWSASVTKNTAGNYTFTVDSVTGNTHAISSLDTDGLSIAVEWVGVTGFVPDTMTLMIVGGAGIAVLGAVIVASRRRRGGVAVDVGDIRPGDFGVVEPTEAVAPVEPEVIEPDVEEIPEEIEPEEIEPTEPEIVEELEESVSDVEADVVDEAVELEEVELPPSDEELTEIEAEDAAIEPEAEVVEEIPEPEEIEPPVEEELEIEPEPSAIEEPIVEPEVESEVIDHDDIPEEFIEPKVPVDLSKLTKREILDIILDDVEEVSLPKDLKRLTKRELIRLVEALKDVEG